MADAAPASIRRDEMLMLAGQPSAMQFRALAASGLEAVVNLAPIATSESALPDEAALLDELGVRYFHLPVAWAGPTVDDHAQFCEMMDAVSGLRTLIHCARNLRVTAFYALYAESRLGWDRARGDALMAKMWTGRPEIEAGGVWGMFVENVPARRITKPAAAP